MDKNEFEQAQIQVLDGLVDLAEIAGYMEKEAILQALRILHSTIFSKSFANVNLYSERTLSWLAKETGTIRQAAV